MKDKGAFRIEYTKLFNKQRKEASFEIKTAFREARELFLENPSHSHLRNHALRGKFASYRSIDITPDWRALFKVRESKTQTVITFHILGIHEQLYG